MQGVESLPYGTDISRTQSLQQYSFSDSMYIYTSPRHISIDIA